MCKIRGWGKSIKEVDLVSIYSCSGNVIQQDGISNHPFYRNNVLCTPFMSWFWKRVSHNLNQKCQHKHKAAILSSTNCIDGLWSVRSVAPIFAVETINEKERKKMLHIKLECIRARIIMLHLLAMCSAYGYFSFLSFRRVAVNCIFAFDEKHSYFYGNSANQLAIY